MLLPVLALVGFLGLMALVIALGIRSTSLYERDQIGVTPSAGRSTVAAEPPDR